MTQEALKLAEDYAHMRAIWYVESLYGTSASHTELREKVMLGAHQALKEALAQTQEPVAWMHVQGNYKEPSFRELADDEVERGWEQYPLYNTPPQRTEQNFCSRCGKRVGGIDSIHTCTPPMEMNT